MVENGTREVEVVGLNPGNARKNHTRVVTFFDFFRAANIYFIRGGIKKIFFFDFYSHCKYLF